MDQCQNDTIWEKNFPKLSQNIWVTFGSLPAFLYQGKHTVNDFLMTKLFMIPSHQNSKNLSWHFFGKVNSNIVYYLNSVF